MNISRHEVNEFYHSSALATSLGVILPISSANNKVHKVRVTDLKMTCGSNARTVKFYVDKYGTYGYPLEFDLPANSSHDFHWEIPHKLTIVASTGEMRNFVGSASGSGVKYNITGYYE